MAWAIITIYISKCAKMNPQQLPKTSKFYSRWKKCDIEKTLGGGYHPLGSPKVKHSLRTYFKSFSWSLGGRSLSFALGGHVQEVFVLVLVLGGQGPVLVLGGQVLVNIPDKMC